MKFKKYLCIIIAIFLTFSLSGCNLLTVDTAELLNPPALSGDISPIADAIKKTAGEEYTFQYPSNGDYRSAVVQNDINGDGKLEAFAFYSTVEDGNTFMNLSVICYEDEKWKAVSQQKIVAGGVDKVEFCDLDKDGIQEIIVGWEIYGNTEMQVAVYSFKDNNLVQRMIKNYTHFICCDINDDDRNEIFIIKTNSSEQINLASIYELNKDGVNEAFVCELDPDIQSINEPVFSHLSSGKPAIYIDAVKGVGATTQVLYIEKNQLVNPLYNSSLKDNMPTLRSSAYTCRDINKDEIIEIPVQESVPSVSRTTIAEKQYIINWCSYNGESLTIQMSTLMNISDGYYFILSSRMIGKIAVLKDTDSSIRELYSYDPETKTIEKKLLYFQKVSKKDWESGKYEGLDLFEVSSNDYDSYLCKITSDATSLGITKKDIKKNFVMIDQ